MLPVGCGDDPGHGTSEGEQEDCKPLVFQGMGPEPEEAGHSVALGAG